MTDQDALTIFDTAFALMAERGWNALTVASICEASGLNKNTVFKVAPTKFALMDAFARHIDSEVLAGGIEDDPEETTKDRLFEIMMRRYDLMGPYRAGLKRLMSDTRTRPLDLLVMGPSIMRAMENMLAAAGIGSEGCKGILRAKGLASVHVSVLRTFVDDDSEDLAKTMAALDRALGRVETYATRFRL
ncbi:MAG: TetR family transcriptional regulator [Alphaproteobacteria bacterium]|nr:TetR family transcriptional regulator [Alphaproteobacteria bacterium]